MLKIKNLSHYFVKWNWLFKNINFEIEKGAIWIFGPSGSWKSTLLKIIWSLIKPKSGEIIFDWKNIFKQNFKFIQKYRSQISWFAFQEFNLIDDLSVKENILLPFSINKNLKLDSQWMKYLLKTLQIENLLEKNLSLVSWGEKERISIAKSMIHKPKILFLDEPGSYLNDELKIQLYKLISEYSKENIVIIVSHDKNIWNYIDLKDKIYLL